MSLVVFYLSRTCKYSHISHVLNIYSCLLYKCLSYRKRTYNHFTAVGSLSAVAAAMVVLKVLRCIYYICINIYTSPLLTLYTTVTTYNRLLSSVVVDYIPTKMTLFSFEPTCTHIFCIIHTLVVTIKNHTSINTASDCT